MSIVPRKVSNLIEAIRRERGFPIGEAEARQYRLVGNKTIATMQELGLIKPPARIIVRPQPSHPLHATDPALAAQLAAKGIWTTDDAERAVKGRRLQPHGGVIGHLGKARYGIILDWISRSGWTRRRP